MTTPTNAMVEKVAVVNLASRQTQMGIALPAMGKALNTLHLTDTQYGYAILRVVLCGRTM
jgi:hypothetical protein